MTICSQTKTSEFGTNEIRYSIEMNEENKPTEKMRISYYRQGNYQTTEVCTKEKARRMYSAYRADGYEQAN